MNQKRDGSVNIGGAWWRCLVCGQAHKAECECCEPTRHCQEVRS